MTLWPCGLEEWTEETKDRVEELARELVGKRGRFAWKTNAEVNREQWLDEDW